MQMAIGCGYGVPTPLNPLSQFIFNIGCLTTKVVFAIYINSVIDIFSRDYKSHSLSDSMAILNRTNQEEELTSFQKREIRSYFRKKIEDSVESWNN